MDYRQYETLELKLVGRNSGRRFGGGMEITI